MTKLDQRRRSIHALSGRTAGPAAGKAKSVRAMRAQSDDGGRTRGALYLYGPISSFSFWERTVSAKSVVEALKDLDVDDLDVHINSPGGDVYEGIAIHNTLRAFDAVVTVHVDGLAASAASVVAMAGKEIVMGQGSQMMVHDPWMLTIGNPAELRDDADWLDKQADNLAKMYARRAGGTAATWRAVMQDETWYFDDEAVAAGLADRVETDDDDVDPEQVAVPTEGDDPDDGSADVEDAWDLSIFNHPGRSHAPAPAATTRPSRTTPKPPSASAVGSPHRRSSAVAFSDDQMTTLRNRLGVAEDADETTILAALDEALDERADSEPAPTAGTAPEGTTLVDSATYEQLRADAAAGREARDQQRADTRDRTIAAAVSDGRISPARAEHWRQQFDADAEGAAATLASLEPGTIPVSEAGHDAGGDSDPANDIDTVRNSDTYKGWEI